MSVLRTPLPSPLVEPDWVADHLHDDDVVVVDVDEDTESYARAHVDGAVGLNWTMDLCHPRRRTVLDQRSFEQLMDRLGVTADTHVVLYGGNHNWFASYAYWTFKLYGHRRLSLMNGGRTAWQHEGRPLTSRLPDRSPTVGYRAAAPDPSIRVFRDEVLEELVGGPPGVSLIDVRSEPEYQGRSAAPPHLPGEAAMVAGHIPGASNVPWSHAVDGQTGKFLSGEALCSLYRRAGVGPDDNTVVYCRIGERAAHTWFVLHEILGFAQVRNYDGSWAEYGSLIDVPVAQVEVEEAAPDLGAIPAAG
ncbi:sulfurtransferase [Euzebya tangerina]|uniref:sulfurtransferase n=1 Tax=Euzebya tangerina TaxID=591198 RepID=UPI00196B4EB0|nr:sulfurtransferase [Euzebya tangerina]